MIPAKILSEINGKDEVNEEDIDEVNELFFDAKSSAKLLKEQAEGYVQQWLNIINVWVW